MKIPFCRTAGVAAAAAIAAFAFDGTGSGKPITPYTTSFPATAANIQKLRDASRANRAYKGLPKAGVGLAFAVARDGKWDQTLDKLGEIDVAEIESVMLVERRGNRLILEVKQFPAISAAELAAKKPTYTELRSGYSRTARVEVDADLALLGRDWFDDPLELRSLARDLKPNEPVELLPERTRYKQNQIGPWWAIPSVTADPKYPHKLVAKA
jgi:hypothetical protein